MDGYIFDYRLGYIRDDCKYEGFDLIGAEDALECRIVTLGGYTTPQQARDGRSWVNALHKQKDRKHQILNGCTDGYSSAQILTLFIRDVILFSPKLVLCLSGFYNTAYKLGLVQNKSDTAFLSTHPFATPGHLHFYREITSRFGLGNDEVYYGTENHLPAWELWLRQMMEIKCLCDEFDIEFKSFLQPCVFSGKYRRSERENSFLRECYAITDYEIEKFHAEFQREYAEIIARTNDIDCITDLSGVFDDHETVYTDAYHVRDEFLPVLTEVISL